MADVHAPTQLPHGGDATGTIRRAATPFPGNG
ncbi:hypothetical protein J2S41_006035 [Catenuloplanes atrovinosus]|uniref:Uncharacterized protein n=1 Tax=Catenuloplanes atrovinosus TaxID=137266 RepID=A0AAE3YV88_9ACTN|nr:hypothetical protein [Catenuloplanes atrovinosus]